VRVIAIDGPAGAGKSTVSRAVAARLDLPYLDTGAMYRAVTWAAIRHGIDPDDVDAVAALARDMALEVDLDGVRVDGEDVTTAIRGHDVNALVSVVAANPGVRAELRRRQREWAAAAGGGVIEGRDIGSVVFPEAELKVYLTASPRERARRRAAEAGGEVEEIAASIAARDHLDSTRDDGPLTEAAGAAFVDTDDRSVDQVVDAIVALLDESGKP
jgi:CMP/dCMP kinase